MVTWASSPFKEKTHMVQPGIEPGTSWLVVRSSDHQATRLVSSSNKRILTYFLLFISIHLVTVAFRKCADFPPCFRLLSYISVTIAGLVGPSGRAV